MTKHGMLECVEKSQHIKSRGVYEVNLQRTFGD